MDPALWTKIPEKIKRVTNFKTFKCNPKKYCLKEIGKSNFSEKLVLLISVVLLILYY